MLASGCATWPHSPPIPEGASPAYVRFVNYDNVPEAKEVAQHVEHLANQKYPAVLALLSASKLPQDFSIVFKRRL